MSATPDLWFAVTGGSGHGLGHVMRCAVLAEEARQRGFRVRFALDGDAVAEASIRANVPGADVTRWSDPADLAQPSRWVVFDSRRDLAPHVRAARRAGARICVLDRVDQVDAADVTVLPVAHALEVRHPRVLQGADVCVLPRALRDHAPAPYPARPGSSAATADPAPETTASVRDRVLVTLGGADPLGLTLAVTEGVARCLERWPGDTLEPSLHCAIGPAFRDDSQLAQRLEAAGATVHLAPSRAELCASMRRSLFAVSGFGTTIYELAWLGTPMVYVAHHRSDAADAGRLASRGIGALAAVGPDFDARSFEAVLCETLLDPHWRKRASETGRELLGDGNGASRILDALFPVTQPGSFRS